ncbi:putative TIM-barrel protein, nifR3 family [Methanolobus tindarius DSM 2278]|uniref:Putative TIM-barrel protein, nifR3 family n=1 Tax=Methanolobus tindarius DSM 2278 TaxID=1090322 RepID=W9DR90_METTI|nr:tRNA dihydrouridine synthase DusB [Methanolobus tindarius]ETA68020.1 putative TIM-barrel protein, nifR3 family [Methanolobus tindarius DSM 2278]
MKIADIKISGNILLAPMSNVTNLPFRLMCKKYGASFTYSEMISSDAVIYENEKSINRGMSCEEERPLGIQIFGNSAENMTKAALRIEEIYQPEIIDINFGCPARLLTKDGCGSALLRSPELIHEIITGLTDNLSTPVTAKIRVLEYMEKTLEIAHLIEDAGADALTVHGRTRQQQYSGKADHSYVKKIKQELSIPVIANGDIIDETSARQVLDYTECDGIMIGRAAMGNPFLFRRISHYLEAGDILDYNECSQRISDLREYFGLLEEYDLMHTVNIKAQAQWFTRGMRNGRHIRRSIASSKTIDEILRSLSEMCKHAD